MRKLNRNDYILNIGHSDLDGISCGIVLGNVFQNIDYLNTAFYKIDVLLQTRDFSKYKHVFITDVYPNDMRLLDRIPNSILMDHHDTCEAYHDISKMRFVDTSKCAAKLVHKFMESYFFIDLSNLNQFIYHVNDYDLWIHESPFSKKLNMLFSMYLGKTRNYSGFRKRFMSGDINLTQDEQEYIRYSETNYKTAYDNAELMEFDHINGCLVTNVNDYISEMCHDLMVKCGYKIVFLRNNKKGNTSIRHCIPSLHIGNLLNSIGLGGGHKFAAGMNQLDSHAIVKDILAVEKILYERFPETRR